MLMPDVNLLLAAARGDHVKHIVAREALAAASAEPVAVSVLTLAAFVRIVMHPRAFPNPTPPALAWQAVDVLQSHPSVRVVAPGPRHLSIFRELCLRTQATGALVADAQHAAVAIEHDAVWLTMDRDFAAFEAGGLRWRWVG